MVRHGQGAISNVNFLIYIYVDSRGKRISEIFLFHKHEIQTSISETKQTVHLMVNIFMKRFITLKLVSNNLKYRHL